MYYSDIYVRAETDYRRERARDDWAPIRRRPRRQQRRGRRSTAGR